MTTHLPLRAALLALALTLSIPAVAAAKTTPAEIRVVDANGKQLADHVQYTASTKVKTNRNATCLSQDNRPSGKTIRLKGASALGLSSDAAKAERRLRPFWVSDASSWGLGVCRFGSASATGSGGWLFNHNHGYASAGADATSLRRGDNVLWYLVDDWANSPGGELELRAPARAKAGSQVVVRVFEYDPQGRRSPAAGATLPGTDAAATDAAGKTVVTVSGKRNLLQATRSGMVSSNALNVCAAPGCPAGHLRRYYGTGKVDRIKVAGPFRAAIKALGGKDVVDLRKAKHPARSVNCGPGRDTLIFKRGKKPRKIKGCERIRRR